MLFYLHSTDSKSIHKNNTAYDFIVELPDTLYFEGKWVYRLIQCEQPSSAKKNIILLDCLEFSYIRETTKPVLRVIDVADETFFPLINVPLKVHTLNRFHIQILDFDTLKIPLQDRVGLRLLWCSN